MFCHLSSTKNNDLILKCSFLSEPLWSSRVAIALGYFPTCSVCHSLEAASCTLLTRKPGGAHVLALGGWLWFQSCSDTTKERETRVLKRAGRVGVERGGGGRGRSGPIG